jgi:hypothetical protein
VRRLLHLVNESTLWQLTVVLVATVVLFGAGYWAASQAGLLHFTYDAPGQPGFLDALYFSVVTIASLGYGDIRPEGWARLLVGLEVVAGLSYFGLIVAKVSSLKQDYILKRMYGEAVDEKLAGLTSQLDDQRALYRTTGKLLLAGEIDPELTTTFRRATPGTTFFSQYRALLAETADLITYEASNHALFGAVSDSRLEATYDSIRGVLRRTTLLWEQDSELARLLILGGNGDELEHICALSDSLAHLATRASANEDLHAICRAILNLTRRIRVEILPSL